MNQFRVKYCRNFLFLCLCWVGTLTNTFSQTVIQGSPKMLSLQSRITEMNDKFDPCYDQDYDLDAQRIKIAHFSKNSIPRYDDLIHLSPTNSVQVGIQDLVSQYVLTLPRISDGSKIICRLPVSEELRQYMLLDWHFKMTFQSIVHDDDKSRMFHSRSFLSIMTQEKRESIKNAISIHYFRECLTLENPIQPHNGESTIDVCGWFEDQRLLFIQQIRTILPENNQMIWYRLALASRKYQEKADELQKGHSGSDVTTLADGSIMLEGTASVAWTYSMISSTLKQVVREKSAFSLNPNDEKSRHFFSVDICRLMGITEQSKIVQFDNCLYRHLGNTDSQ